MQLLLKQTSTRLLLALITFIAFGIIAATLVKAQDDVKVTITGTLQAVNSDGTIVVDGMTYKLNAGVAPPASAQIGKVVALTGQFTTNNTLVIIIITVPNPTPTTTPTATPAIPATLPATNQAPTPTPGASPTPPPDGDVIVVVEGPVHKININIITIFDIDVLLAENHPMLRVIKIGDFVRVRGSFKDTGVLAASFISNVLIPSSKVSVSLEGPVQVINGNSVVVNGINVQLPAGDPILAKLKVGDTLRVDGNFQGSGTTIILIVVHVVIVNNVVVVRNPGSGGLPPGCKWTGKGNGRLRIKCSKKSDKGSRK